MKNGNWYKYEGNPVMGGPETGTCYDVDVRFEDELYKMNFTWRPHRSIAQSESPGKSREYQRSIRWFTVMEAILLISTV